MAIGLLSWVKNDPNYANRKGYQQDFLRIAVPVPKLGTQTRKLAALSEIPYQHFSLLTHPKRKLPFWTAVNIDGGKERRLGARQSDTWWFDKRDDETYVPYQVGDDFYTHSGFERGHLVRRLDPAWGSTDAAAARAEADSFHWTNCAPQVPKLNKQWWGKVENHVLKTANANNDKISVFSGCLFTSKDPKHPRYPKHASFKIPLAYWKVVAWTVGRGSSLQLRSLAFFVKQDEAVARLLNTTIRPLAVKMEDVPAKIQGYQTTVAELEAKVGMTFGRLSAKTVDVYAMARSQRLAPLAFNDVDAFRRLRRPSDLITGV